VKHRQFIAAVLDRYGQLVNSARFDFLNGNVEDAQDISMGRTNGWGCRRRAALRTVARWR